MNTTASQGDTPATTKGYGNAFLHEVENRVGQGEWLKMCTQCGACAGACPTTDSGGSGTHGGHSPQSLFMMIRAGQRSDVLGSETLWNCMSCSDCAVLCPSRIPVADIIQGLAFYAESQGLAPRQHPNRVLAMAFWENVEKHGRVNEAELGMRLNFRAGFGPGVAHSLAIKDIALKLIKANRLTPLALGSLVGLNVGHTGIRAKAELRAILAKARALEKARDEGENGD
ncbi:MAG: 4Fe-4S dicluster domain-containing protein [Gammaproteobacteria bacterium]